MEFRRCGHSGLLLPAVSLGLWHNFGGVDPYCTARDMICRAFDLGVTHFDLANNYGPPPGSAEETFGRVLRAELGGHRDEIVITSKAGHPMWSGPYGDGGSRKYLIASLDQSLQRMGVDYVDIFYHHRPDPDTPMEETMAALDQIVRDGKALYVGVSSYDPEQTARAQQLLAAMGTRCLVHQPRYSMFDRGIEEGLLDTLNRLGMGCVVFSPLAQGLLTNKYLRDIPPGSRAAATHGFLQTDEITEGKRNKIRQLDSIAGNRGQTLAQLAVTWVLRHPAVTSAIVGASRPAQLEETVSGVTGAASLTEDEKSKIDEVLALPE